MTPNQLLLIESAMITLLAVMCFFFGMVTQSSMPGFFAGAQTHSASADAGTLNCTNMSLSETAECLKNYVSTFFNYTQRNDTDKTIEDIKQNGGDCYDYSLLYTKLAKSLGFNASQVTFQIQGNDWHGIAVLTDPNFGYCIIDQLSGPWCIALDIPKPDEAMENQTVPGGRNETPL